MKVLYQNNITSIEASTSLGAYPVTNLENDHVKRIWKANGHQAQVAVIANGGDALAVFGTNAISIGVYISTGSSVGWETGVEWEAGIQWIGDEQVISDTVYNLTASQIGSLWANIDYIPGQIITLNFMQNPGVKVYSGIVQFGDSFEMRDPDYGMTEGIKDLSLIQELSNGAIDVTPRDSLRKFSLKYEIDRDDDFYTFMYSIMRPRGLKPMAWRLSSTLNNWEWIVYARPDGNLPIGTHAYPGQTIIDLKLIEVV